MATNAEEIKKKRLAANIPPPASLNKYVDGLASVYIFETRPDSYGGSKAFHYDVELTQLGRDKSLTKGGGDDGKNGLLKNICYELMLHVHKATQGFGVKAEFVYDNRKNLFTDKQFNSMTLEIETQHVEGTVCDFTVSEFLRGSSVRVEIKPCETQKHALDLNDLSPPISRDPGEQSDHSLRMFLDLLTSQTFINSRTHDFVGAGRLFERAICKELEDGIVTRRGIAKGARIIDNNGEPKAALVADVKTCAFFANKNLEEIVKDMLRKRRLDINNSNAQMDRFWADFNRLYRGVSGYLTYAPSRVIVIDSISQRKMSDISFDVEGTKMNMVEFFRTKKNIPINGNMPAIRQQQDRETLFPMSCVVILPNQRLSLDKMSDFVSRELLNANTTHPSRRYADIEAEVKKIGTGTSKDFMNIFGVKLIGGKNDVKIGIHDLPKVKFGGNVTASFQDRINPAVRFLETSNLMKSWVVGFPRQIGDTEVRSFVEQVIRMGRSRGMQLSEPQFECIEFNDIEKRMQELAARRVQFLLYIDSKFVKSHSLLKLNEKRFGMLTQHVTSEVAFKARAMTLSNVLNKMNMKLFGFNYMPIFPQVTKNKFDMDSGDVLVIGLDTSRPPKATPHEKYKLRARGLPHLTSEEPMIVGICANWLKNPYKFNGDYYFQPHSPDVLADDPLLYKVKWVLAKVKKNRAKLPSVVFVIRDGVSEGMVPDNLPHECTMCVTACSQFDPNWKPKFVFCIVDKKHNKRFFVKGGAQQTVENTTPGSVIDTKVIRVDLHEFWLQSHVPLKGTSKIPQYVFPLNQVNANNNELQSFLLSLCSSWQIVMLAPALPTPVRQAGELAKRGRANYLELKRCAQASNSSDLIPRVTGTQEIDYKALNSRLCYNGHIFADTRFNA